MSQFDSSLDPFGAVSNIAQETDQSQKAPSSSSSDINIDDFETVDVDQIPKPTSAQPFGFDSEVLSNVKSSDIMSTLSSDLDPLVTSSADQQEFKIGGLLDLDPLSNPLSNQPPSVDSSKPEGAHDIFDPLLDLGSSVPGKDGTISEDTSPNVPPSGMMDPITAAINEPLFTMEEPAFKQEISSVQETISPLIEPTPVSIDPIPPPREPSPPPKPKEPTPPIREPSPPPKPKEPTPPREPSPPPKEPTPSPPREPSPPPKVPTPPPKEPTPPPPKEPTPPPPKEPTPPPPKEPSPPPKEPTPPRKEPTPPPKEPSPPPKKVTPPPKEPSPVSAPQKAKVSKGAVQEYKVSSACSKEVKGTLAVFNPCEYFTF